MSWMNERRALVSSLELAKDVGGAEALLARHKEIRVSGAKRMKDKGRGTKEGGRCCCCFHATGADRCE